MDRLDALHRGGGRTHLQPFSKLVNGVCRASRKHLDATVRQIVRPPYEAQAHRLLCGAGPEPDSLNFASDKKPFTGARTCAHRVAPASASRASRLRSRASSAISFAALASLRA